MTNSIIYKIIFLFISIYVLLKTVGYGIYEIKEKENKIGGISVIVFSLAVVVFAQVGFWDVP